MWGSFSCLLSLVVFFHVVDFPAICEGSWFSVHVSRCWSRLIGISSLKHSSYMWREGPCILGNEYMFWCHGSWTQHFAGQAEAMRWLPALPFRVWGLPFPHRGLTWFEALSCFSHPRAHSQGVCPDSSVTCRVLSASVCAANSTGLVCGWWSVQLFSIPLITCLLTVSYPLWLLVWGFSCFFRENSPFPAFFPLLSWQVYKLLNSTEISCQFQFLYIFEGFLTALVFWWYLFSAF